MASLHEFGWNVLGEGADVDPALYCRAWIGTVPNDTVFPEGLRRADYVAVSGLAGITRPLAPMDFVVHPHAIRWTAGDDRSVVANGSIHQAFVHGLIDRVDNLPAFMRELYRACAHGAIVNVVAPYWNHVDAHADPTRRRGLSERLLGYFSGDGRPALLADPYEDAEGVDACRDVDFKVRQLRYTLEPGWDGRSVEAKRHWVSHGTNVVKRLAATLIVIKPPRDAVVVEGKV